MLDPFAGARRLDNGAIFYEVKDSELPDFLNDEDKLRSEYDKLKEFENNPIETGDDSDDLKIALVQELEQLNPYALDEFEKVLDKELSVFKDGEQYSYIKDLKEAFEHSLAKPKALQILETIPDHVFWDIKTPQFKLDEIKVNPYNPFRKYPFESYFDFMDYQEYMDRRRLKKNLADGLSLYRRY